MKLHIPYRDLSLIPYQGAGNKTPVLDISMVADINSFMPEQVKLSLEKDLYFRKWLQQEGRKHDADTIMIFYKAKNEKYEYVTFVAEPNNALSDSFSEMCGNGIRCLSLHIALGSHSKKNIKILAGSVKNIEIKSIDYHTQKALIAVNIGKFQSDTKALQKYINFNLFHDFYMSQFSYLDNLLQKGNYVFGFNGTRKTGGEPHMVLLFSLSEYKALIKNNSTIENTSDIFLSLRKLVCLYGSELTFNTRVFPKGININVAIVANNKIFVSTHERNMVIDKDMCLLEQARNNFCKCNTMACGTGGAVVANIAKKLNYIKSDKIKTIHPGGEIFYILEKNRTIMIGSAEKM